MNEQVQKYLQPALSFWKNMSKKTKNMVVGLSIAVVLISVAIVAIMNIQTYEVLYSGMDQEEAVQVIKSIQGKGIDCKLESGGNVLVPKDQVDSLRMQLASEGYPQTATNYNIFLDNIDLMTTDFEKREIKIYQLNERLKATIETISTVKNAIVTISIPEDSGYAWSDDSKDPSASVMIQTIGNTELTSSQVNGIKQLVSKSVPGLDTENIAVVDSSGKELDSSNGETQMDITQLGFVIKQQFEDDLKAKIVTILEPTFGKNNYQVSVSGIVNLDKKIQEIITYTPTDEENNKGILSEGSKETEITTDGDGTGSTPGTDQNADLPSYGGITISGDVVNIKDSETYKYLVNQIKEQVQHDSAVLEKLYVAVTINQESMTTLQKNELKELVAFAAATTSDHVYIYNTKFTQVPIDEDPDKEPDKESIWQSKLLIYYAGGAGLGLILLLILFNLIFGRRKKRKRSAQPIEEEEDSQDYTEADIEPKLSMEEKLRAINESRQLKTKEKIQDFTSKNPEATAMLIRSWLKEEGDS